MNEHDSSRIPLHLREISSKGYDFVGARRGAYLKAKPYSVLPYSNEQRPDKINTKSKVRVPTVAFCFDGPFLPVRNGASYSLFGLLTALGKSEKINPVLVLCYRGDDPERYFNQPFKTIFIHPTNYYHHDNVIREVFERNNVSNVQFCSSEGLLNLGPFSKKLGLRVIFDIQNIDYVLEKRLEHSSVRVRKAKNLQQTAVRSSDYILCRSEIDAHYSLNLGASSERMGIYRGGINLETLAFCKKSARNKKLVFLAHMYYEPNENALVYFIKKVLPLLPQDFTLTVIGNSPETLVRKYSTSQIEFKQNVDDLSAELPNYAVAIAPILEGSGTRLKVLDYLAVGLPVVATTIAIEGLLEGIEAVVSVADNPQSTVDEIISITHNPSFYERRAIEGRRYVERYYAWNNQLAPFLKAYKVTNH